MARTKADPTHQKGGNVSLKSPKKLRSATTSTTTNKKKIVPKVPRKYRYRPGQVALREIRRYQRNTDNLIPLSPFQKLVREIMLSHCNGKEYRMQALALRALRDACEDFMVQLFEDVQACCEHAKRKTILPKDFHLALRIRNHTLPYGIGSVERVESAKEEEEDEGRLERRRKRSSNSSKLLENEGMRPEL